MITSKVNRLFIKTNAAKYFASFKYYTTTHDQIEEFQQNGVICLRQVFEEKYLKLTKDGIENNLREPSKYCDWLIGEKGDGLFFNDYYNLHIKEYKDYVKDSPAAKIAGQLMKSKKSVFFHEHVFYKKHGSTKETPWHHDQAYYPLNGLQNCSIWMPVTKVEKSVGVKFIKGSHKLNTWFLPRLFMNHKSYEILDKDDEMEVQDIQSVIDNIHNYDVLRWDVEPGDCIAFHMKTIHGTEKSVSTDTRMVMSTRWVGDDITYAARPWKTSPPRELLPFDLKIGDKLVNNKHFLVPWQTGK